MSIRRIVLIVLANIIVSAAVVLLLLRWWNSQQPEGSSPDSMSIATLTATRFVTPLPTSTPVTPTAVPTPEPLRHVVQSGETLGAISLLYDIALVDLMEANGISDPNLLSQGQQLIVPVIWTPTPAPEASPTGTPSMQPAPIATQVVFTGSAIIKLQSIDGVGQLSRESVTIVNEGTRPLSLEGWRLVPESGQDYLFGRVTLFGAGSLLMVHSAAGSDSPTDLYWGLDSAIWLSGQAVMLVDAEGTTRSTLIVP